MASEQPIAESEGHEKSSRLGKFFGSFRKRKKSDNSREATLKKMKHDDLVQYAMELENDSEAKAVDKEFVSEKLQQLSNKMEEVCNSSVTVQKTYNIQTGEKAVMMDSTANIHNIEEHFDKMTHQSKCLQREAVRIRCDLKIALENLDNVSRKIDVLLVDSDKTRDKEILLKINDIKSLLQTENKARNMNKQNLENMVEDAVDSIRKRECFANSITASALPENAKPLHRWLINRYGHKPRYVERTLCGLMPAPVHFFYQENDHMDENMCALWLVTWVKDDTNNTAENLIYLLNCLDEDILAEEEQKIRTVPVKV